MVAICRSIRSNCVNPIIHCRKTVFQATKNIVIRIWTAVLNFFQSIAAAIRQSARTCMGFKRMASAQPQLPVNPIPNPIQVVQPAPQPPRAQDNNLIENQPVRPLPNPIRLPNVELPNIEQPQAPLNPINQANGVQDVALIVRNKLRLYEDLPIRRDLDEAGLIEFYTNRRLFQSGQLSEELMKQAKDNARDLSPDSSIDLLRQIINLHRELLNPNDRKKFDEQLKECDQEVVSIIPSLCIRALIFTTDILRNRLLWGSIPLILKDKNAVRGEIFLNSNEFFKKIIDLRIKFVNLPDACKKAVLERRTVGDREEAIPEEARKIIHEANKMAGELSQGHFAFDDVLMRTIMAMTS